MAWIFSLSAECGLDEDRAQLVAKHFDGLAVILDDGSKYLCSANVFDIDHAWWVMCCPSDVTVTGINNAEDERVLTAIGFVLYEHLKTSPPYRFASVGVEVDGWRDYNEIDSDVIELDFSGLVLADAT